MEALIIIGLLIAAFIVVTHTIVLAAVVFGMIFCLTAAVMLILGLAFRWAIIIGLVTLLLCAII